MLYKTLNTFSIKHKILMTGTPVQNNITELWSLLHFICPQLFDDVDAFEKWFPQRSLQFSPQKSNQSAEALHKILKPFLLRRHKSQVLKDLPKKKGLFCASKC